MSGLIRTLDAIKKQIDTIAKHAEGYQKAKEPIPTGPLVRVRNEVDFPVEIKRRYYSDQEKSYALQVRTFWVGVLTLIALAVYTFATYRMLGITKDELDEMRLDQRPWIELSGDFLPIQVGSADIATLHLFGIGKNPANHITGRVAVETVQNGDDPKLDFVGPINTVSTGVIFPNAKPIDFVVQRTRSLIQQATVTGPGPTVPDPLSDADFMKFSNNWVFFIVYARLEYFDGSGVEHWTQFCMAKGHDARLISSRKCIESYNAIDNR